VRGDNYNSAQSQSYVTTDCQSASLSSSHLKPKNRFLLDSYGFVDVGRPLRREDGVCRLQLLLAFARAGPAGLMTIFYCLGFEALPTWRARSPYLFLPGTGWPSYAPRHWVPFSSPLTTCRATLEVLVQASTRGICSTTYNSLIHCVLRQQLLKRSSLTRILTVNSIAQVSKHG
jgi:hypothetical protein